MFAQIVEEVISHVTSVCATPAQRTRIIRARQEADAYRYQDVSDLYEEPAVRVTSLNGEYLTFPDHCTCADWSKRGPVLGTGEIAACKHQLACHFNGQFVQPAEKPAPVALPMWKPELLAA